MQWYRSNDNVRVLAAKPEDANLDFCLEAKKYGIDLYEIQTYDFSAVAFLGKSGKYFGESPTKLITAPNQYLILFGEKEWLVLGEKVFNSLFQPVGEAQTPETPAIKKLAGKKFYLDAGHGGTDPGAVNNNFSLMEKIAALDVCLFLGELLEAQGAEVKYSRTGDTYPGLTQRATEANNWGADCFISIHLNSADNKSASGIETLVYSTTTPAYKLAEIVQKNMILATGWLNRGVKTRPDLAVLKKTAMPAILCEIGFISNDEQALKLFDEKVQRKIANAICEGVVEYFG